MVLGTLIVFSLNIYARIDQDVPRYPSHHFYALGLINALVFAKIMLIAEAARVGSRSIGRRLESGRLVTVILYRALAFTAVLIAAYVLEAVLEGAWHGRAPGQVLPEIAGLGLGLVGRCRERLLRLAATDTGQHQHQSGFSIPWCGEQPRRRERSRRARVSQP